MTTRRPHTVPPDLKPEIDAENIRTEKEAARTVERLRAAIRYHDQRYYVEDDPVISDGEYDELMVALRRLETRFPELRDDYSPTQRVGGMLSAGTFETVSHPVPMQSLRAVHDTEEVRAFDRRCRKTLGRKAIRYVSEPKYDGLAIELTFDQGSLLIASTRGDGDSGEDVTANIRTINEIPLVLLCAGGAPPKRLVARGEVYMRKDELKSVGDYRTESLLLQIPAMRLRVLLDNSIQRLPQGAPSMSSYTM